MRRFFCWYNVKRILCWLLVLALVAAGVYLFDIDYKIRPSRDIDIQTLAECLAPLDCSPGSGRFMKEDTGFDAWLIIDVDEEFQYEGDETTLKEFAEKHALKYQVVPEQDVEMVVWLRSYMPLMKALGYGWLNYDGNLIEKWYGSEEAEGKPNYRNLFSIFLRKGEYYYWFNGFCRTGSMETFLKESVRIANENFPAA